MIDEVNYHWLSKAMKDGEYHNMSLALNALMNTFRLIAKTGDKSKDSKIKTKKVQEKPEFIGDKIMREQGLLD